MAKLSKASEYIEELASRLSSEAGLENFMAIKPIAVSKQNVLIKVARANATTEYVGKCPDTVFLYVYEKAFERLSDKQQELLMRDAISTISYDPEKDKISVGCPQIVVTVGGRMKYGDELIDAAECGVMMIEEANHSEEPDVSEAEAKETAKEAINEVRRRTKKPSSRYD